MNYLTKILLLSLTLLSTTACEEARQTSTKTVSNNSEKPIKETVTSELAISLSQSDISFKRLAFKGNKTMMLAVLGQPDSIVEPHYDCGVFSATWQEKKFYQYFYSGMNFMVYDDIAEVETVDFRQREHLLVKGIDLAGGMLLEEIAKKFNLIVPAGTSPNSIKLYPKEAEDEYYLLEFEVGKLVRFSRFDPC